MAERYGIGAKSIWLWIVCSIPTSILMRTFPDVSKKNGLPKYMVADWDRHGNMRLYFRRKGQKKARLDAPANSEEFWRLYALAAAGKSIRAETPTRPIIQKVKPETFGAVCEAFLKSPEIIVQDTATQTDKRVVLQGMYDEPLTPDSELIFKNCPIKSMTAKHIRVLRNRKTDVPNAANKRLRYLAQVFQYAIDEELIESNPVKDVKKLKVVKKGFHPWTLEELKQFEERHPVGSKARLAVSIFALTGFRLSDAAQFGPEHLVKVGGTPFEIGRDKRGDGWIKKQQWKGRRLLPKMIEIPLLEILEDIIAATPEVGKKTFLETPKGEPFSIKGLGNKVKEWCAEADLPHCSAHGIRKIGTAIALENGATDAQVMSIFGWKSAKEIATYAAGMRRKKIAAEAIHLLVPREENVPPEND